MPELKYRDERGELVAFPLEGREVIIGRLPDCDVVLAKPYVSRQHARVFRENGSWFVEDLGSAGGTFLNRSVLNKRATLTDGDEIGIGDLRVTFNTPESVGTKTATNMARPSPAPPPGGMAPGATRKTLLGEVAGDEAFAATNPGYVLPKGLVSDVSPRPAASKKPEVRVRQAAGSGAYAKLAIRARQLDATKALAPDRTGSMVDSAIASTAIRFASEIVGGPGDRAAIHRRALTLALRALAGDRAALAIRRDDGAYATVGSVIASAGKYADATFAIDSALIDDIVATREGFIAHEGDEAVSDGRTVKPAADVRTILCVPFLEKDRIGGWIYVDARGVRSDLGPVALDLLAFIASTSAHAAAAR